VLRVRRSPCRLHFPAERLWQEIRASRQESEKRWQEAQQEIRASRQETDRLIGSFNLQLGRLGNKLGDYAESLAFGLREA